MTQPPSPRDRSHIALFGLSAAVVVALGAWIATRPERPRNPWKQRSDMPALAGGHGVHVERSVTVMCPAEDLYSEWQDLTRWPELVPILQSVTLLGGNRSRWIARGPAGVPVEWEADLVSAQPDQLIAWRSVDDGDVEHAGSVRFTPAPGGRGTEVKVILAYSPPGGRLGAAVASIFGKSADRQVREGLRRFKQRMEAHEVADAGALDGHRAVASESVRA